MQLILVPTRLELGFVPRLDFLDEGDVLELCGFGPIVAAGRTSQLLAELRPSRVWLIGIAGAYPGGALIGQAHEFNSVGCYGVGVGDSSDYKSTEQLGWKAWEGPLRASSSEGANEANDPHTFGDVIELSDDIRSKRRLLTVCAASAHSHDVQHRRQHFPMATAEDMEAYGVAVACQLAHVPLRVIRGISNLAGNRDKSLWQVAEAMESAAEQLRQLYCQE